MSEKQSRNPAVALVIGAMNLDILATAGQSVLSDDSTPGQVFFCAGGVGRNIAEGLCRLSVDTLFYSAVGNDPAGRQLLALCESAGLGTDNVDIVTECTTPVYVSMNSSNGHLLHAVSDMSLFEEHQWQLPGSLSDTAEDAGICVIDANLPESVIKQVAAISGKTQLVAEAVSVSKCRRLAGVLSRLALLKVNLQEAAVLTGCELPASAQILGHALLAMGPQKVLITLGEDGVVLYERGAGTIAEFKMPAQPADIVNVNGAGDAMLAGFIAAQLHGFDTPVCLKWGALAARFSLESRCACSAEMTVETLKKNL